MKYFALSTLLFAAYATGLYADEVYPGIDLTKDVEIQTSAGHSLVANLYKPDTEGTFPVIVTMTPYGKDKVRDFDYEDGIIDASELTSFEALDPKFWVPNGYAILVVDTTGTNKSGGKFSLTSDQEPKDYYDVIEWAGTQDWSTGAVATSGVSYLAMNQWRVAELNPPHLKAIMPWHGLPNMYRDLMRPGGMLETRFFGYWYGKVIKKNANMPLDDMIGYVKDNPFFNDDYSSMAADLSKITVPAYVAAAWTDRGLHLDGTLKAFDRISSEKKWLEVTGRKKWEQYYSWGAQQRMLAFADHFLKGRDNGWDQTPSVRYELMHSYYLGEIQQSETFPPENSQTLDLFLGSNGLGKSVTTNTEKVLLSSSDQPGDQLRFNYTFSEDVEITGHIQAELFVEATKGNDLDLFVELEKYDAAGDKVKFAVHGSDDAGFAGGFLRASMRELDMTQSTDTVLEYSYRSAKLLGEGEVVPVKLALSAASVSFKAGETLSMVISNSDIIATSAQHSETVNLGPTRLSMGGEYTSHLKLPVVR